MTVVAVAAKDDSSSHKKASNDSRILPLIILNEVRKVWQLDLVGLHVREGHLQGSVRHLDFFRKKNPGALYTTLSVGSPRGECSFPDSHSKKLLLKIEFKKNSHLFQLKIVFHF